MTTRFVSLIVELLDDEVGGEQPPAQIDVRAAIRRGQSRLRWRRAGLASAAPALAAVTVAAIALVGTVSLVGPPAGTSRAGRQAAASAPSAAQTGFLPVLRTDARFDWLPAGEELGSGLESGTTAYMNIDAGKVFSWELTVWATGTCALERGASAKLVCQFGGGVSPAHYPVDARAPSIRGHEAFWTTPRKQHQEIIWDYAPGAWAVFQSPSCCSARANRQPVATLLRIARGISFGPASGEPLSFNFQLTDVPSDWRVSSVGYQMRGGSLLANAVALTAQQDPRTDVNISLTHGGTGNSDPCWTSAAAPTTHTMLRGYTVETTTNPPSYSDRGSNTYELCANDVGGISFGISTSDHADRTPAELFERMRFLGPKPADWATDPIN